MTEQAKERRREYKREWYKRNRDKAKAAQDRYWDKKARQAKDKQEQATAAEG